MSGTANTLAVVPIMVLFGGERSSGKAGSRLLQGNVPKRSHKPHKATNWLAKPANPWPNPSVTAMHQLCSPEQRGRSARIRLH